MSSSLVLKPGNVFGVIGVLKLLAGIFHKFFVSLLSLFT